MVEYSIFSLSVLLGFGPIKQTIENITLDTVVNFRYFLTFYRQNKYDKNNQKLHP